MQRGENAFNFFPPRVSVMRFLVRAASFVVIAALLSSADPAGAQAALREGLKVRVIVPGTPRVTGVVSKLTPDSVFLFSEPGGIPVALVRSPIQSIQVSHGKSASAGARKGALWGGGVFGGLVVLASIGLASDPAYKADTSNFGPVAFALIGIAEGVGIGALIGALVKSERWETMSLSPTVGMSGNGLRLGVRVR